MLRVWLAMKRLLIAALVSLVSACSGGSRPALNAEPSLENAAPAQAMKTATLEINFTDANEWLTALRAYVAADEREAVASLFGFPFQGDDLSDEVARGLGESFGDFEARGGISRELFLKHYDSVFDADSKAKLLSESLRKDPDDIDIEYPDDWTLRIRGDESANAWWVITKDDNGYYRAVAEDHRN